MRIERAVREKTFTLTSIAGPSGSGKTYSAILYARGLVGPEGKIGFIDTENKRSRFYADVGGGFDVIDLDPPFTSARYVEAINAFQDAGYTAIVIDSISHEWEGTGGVLEQAEAIEEKSGRAGLHCWKKPKGAHKRLMNELLQTKAHLIFCCRVKEKVAQVKGDKGKAEIVNQGFVVVQEKSFIYEMTVSMMLEEGTHVPVLQKCPDDMIGAFPVDKPLTIEHGGAVRRWADKGQDIDPLFKADRLAGLTAANQGTAALQTWWKDLPTARKKPMEALKDTFKSVAAARDLMASELAEQSESLSDRLGSALGGEQEGFNLDFVSKQTSESSSSTDPRPEDDTAAEPSSPTHNGSAAGESISSQESGPEVGGNEAADGQSAPPASEPDMVNSAKSNTEFLKADMVKMLVRLAGENLTQQERLENLDGAYPNWVSHLPGHPTLVKQCFDTAAKVIKGELPAAKAKQFMEGLL